MVNPMAVRQPRYSKKEFARRGDEIYKSQVRPQVEEGNYGKIVAINIETGAFEVADTAIPQGSRQRQARGNRFRIALDERKNYREDRWVGLGMLDGRVVVVVFTEPDEETIRIISLRKALPYERKRYEQYLKNEL
jgi:uncharacterized DUF497 family protein